jgi:hypothetical protein
VANLDASTATLTPNSLGVPIANTTRLGFWVLDLALGRLIGDARCTCPGIVASGAVTLRGREGEALDGWALGYIQLKFIATDYARYRGRSVGHGSVLVTRSNQTLCRDTDETSPELWYDPIAWGIHGTRGTRVVPAGTRMPASGEFVLTSDFSDAPSRSFDKAVQNTSTGAINFVHHVDIGLQFVTILTARDPAGHYHPLKHFYWNVRWEFHFDQDGRPALRPKDHLELNIQRKVHSGVPDDKRFKGRELDAALPISNTVTRRPARIHPARDWAQG